MVIQHSLRPTIDLGLFSIHLYGLIIAISFFIIYFFADKSIKKTNIPISSDSLMSFMGITFIITILFSRLGYIFLYWDKDYLKEPTEILHIQDGGFSYHTGLLAAVLSIFVYGKIKKIRFLSLVDCFVIGTPLAVFLAKIGHFINGELWGRVTSGGWGIIFVRSAENPVPRHPVQIYEAILEGLLVYFVLNNISKKNEKSGYLFASFLILSGLARFFTEFFREPDIQLGYLFSYFTMGQLLSIPVILTGLIILMTLKNKAAEK